MLFIKHINKIDVDMSHVELLILSIFSPTNGILFYFISKSKKKNYMPRFTRCIQWVPKGFSIEREITQKTAMSLG